VPGAGESFPNPAFKSGLELEPNFVTGYFFFKLIELSYCPGPGINAL